MTKPTKRRLTLKRETLRRLASDDLARVAGGLIARCTYEKSGCYGQEYSRDCLTNGCTGDPESNCCLM